VALPDLVAKGGLDLLLPAGHQAEFDFIATAQQTHRCSVTRATAANPCRSIGTPLPECAERRDTLHALCPR